MYSKSFEIIRHIKHHTFWFSGSTRSIEDVGQIIVRSTRSSLVNLFFMRKLFTFSQEFTEIDRRLITRIFLYFRIKDNKLLQRIAQAEYREGCIILKLLTDKKVPYLCIVHNILNLRRRTGRIERNG